MTVVDVYHVKWRVSEGEGLVGGVTLFCGRHFDRWRAQIDDQADHYWLHPDCGAGCELCASEDRAIRRSLAGRAS